jgi:ankyrin repeat protein
VSRDDLVAGIANHLDADPRSIARWMAGEPTGRLCWPYRPTVQAALGKDAATRIGVGGIDQITGWLMLAVAFQSLPSALRDLVRRDYKLRPQHPWSLDDVVGAMNRRGFHQGDRPVRAFVIPILERIELLFTRRVQNAAVIQKSLAKFQVLIDQESPDWRRSYLYIHHCLSARLAAITGKEDEALRLYEAAVAGVWWYGGPNQHPIINEALLYAVGVGKKIAADHYWDKTYLLGLNTGPKRPLDKQELRRISFGFEKLFSPLKAKERIPPRAEVILRDEKFGLSPEQLANPNRKVKFAEGRTRRTPLMDAIQEGTLDDVKLAIEAGGNPNDYIKESGEGPLSYAMRRACDRKDPTIMEYILSLDLLPETVNRPASTMRETAMKIAIEMANAKAVERLIELGADVEHACDYVPSALCYAMLLLHGSLHRDDPTQERAYLEGKTRADVYDAKDGAVLSVDLAARRQSLLALRQSSDRKQQIFDAMMEYFIRPADDHRQVIQVLLRRGANANRRYKVEAHHIAEWTPTLFAAQVGDIDVFKMLVEHPGDNRGDPELTLMQTSALERFDALWVAVNHDRHAIVSYLMERHQR